MKTGCKATYDYFCRDHKFEIGQTYELSEKPIMCYYGFHYCVNPKDVLQHYPIKHDFRLLEIEDLGESITQGNKSVTNKLRVVREIPKEEYYSLFGIVNNELTIIDEEDDYWATFKYDERNNLIRYDDSYGNWVEREYDQNNNQVYYKNSPYTFS